MAVTPQPLAFKPAEGRFEMPLSTVDKPAISSFMQLDAHTLNILHTEVPVEAQGMGIGTHMISEIVQFALTNQYRLIPTCPVLKRYLIRHPEFRKVLEPVR